MVLKHIEKKDKLEIKGKMNAINRRRDSGFSRREGGSSRASTGRHVDDHHRENARTQKKGSAGRYQGHKEHLKHRQKHDSGKVDQSFAAKSAAVKAGKHDDHNWGKGEKHKKKGTFKVNSSQENRTERQDRKDHGRQIAMDIAETGKIPEFNHLPKSLQAKLKGKDSKETAENYVGYLNRLATLVERADGNLARIHSHVKGGLMVKTTANA